MAEKAIPEVRVTQIQVRYGTHGELASSRLQLVCPLGLAQLRVVYLCKSSLTQGGTSQKPSKVYHNDDPTHATSPTHSVADRQLPMGMG